MNATGALILTAQNEERQLARLAAQRAAYSRAKCIWAVCTVASFAAPLLTPLAGLWPELKPWLALYAGLLTVFDVLLFDTLIKAWQRKGASIQEDFDCDVLRLHRNPLKTDATTEPETIYALASTYRKSDPDLRQVTDWYAAPIAVLPLGLARIACQRTNLWWDSDLRRRYASALWCASAIALVVVVLVAFCLRVSFQEAILLCVIPMLPVVIWCSRESTKQRALAADCERSRQYIEKRWPSLATADYTTQEREARMVQDAIFDRRRSASPVFDWFYRSRRAQQEEQAKAGAEELIRVWTATQTH